MSDTKDQSGLFVGNFACKDCGSRDNLSIYKKEDDDGNEYHDGFCWSCDKKYKSPSALANMGYEVGKLPEPPEGTRKQTPEEVKALVEDILENYENRGVRERKIPLAIAEMYDMRVGYHPVTGKISEHYYPVTKRDEETGLVNITGFYKRELPKKFSSIGDVSNCQLQGQHLFEEGGPYATKASKKFIIVTEGYLDMLAVQCIMKEISPKFLTAVVSLPNGINPKAIKQNYQFLNDYEKVLICVDQDDVGRKGARELCKHLPLGKASIMSFSEKDGCDMLKRKKFDEFRTAFWNAESYSPAGVVSGEGLWNIVSTPPENDCVYYPWEGLNDLTHGIRPSEMITLTAGSGVAKSTFARKILHHLLSETEENIGGIFLEESIRKTGLSIMSMEAKKLLHLPEVEYTNEEMQEAFQNTLGTGRVFLYDHFGSADIDTISEAITYFVKAADCKYIFLDHISIMVSAGGHGDERKALDEICTKLRTLVQELDITLFIISHLKRPSGDKGHEDGAETSLAQLRGSAGIAQLSDIVLGFERNGQHPDPLERNTTTVRVLKNRFSGETGIATRILYNNVTGELVERKEVDDQSDVEEFLGTDQIEEDLDLTDY